MICPVKYKNKKGFTLIELLIVISVIGLFSGISTVAYKRLNERSIFNRAVDTIIQSVRYSKNKAINQKTDFNWGVYIEDNQVTVFSGDNYISRNSSNDEIFNLPSGISVSGLTEVVFDKITGKIGEEGDIIISRGNDQRTIHINSYGVVFYDDSMSEVDICQDLNATNYGGSLPCQYEGTYPTGSISSTPESCTIAIGSNSCQTTLSWDTQNPIGTSTITKSGTIIATGNSGSQSVTSSYGSNTYNLNNDGSVLDSVNITGLCISGASWNGLSCVSSTVGSISSTPESCIIAIGSNSCQTTLSWDTQNPIGTSTITKSGTIIATGNSGSQSVTSSYGSNTYNLNNNGSLLDFVEVSASCELNSSWNDSICEEEIFVPTFNYSLDMNNDWGSGYCTNVTITTDSPDPVLWEVDVLLSNPPQNGTPTSVWNATWSFENEVLTISGIAEWNFYVSESSPNTSVGFCANR